MFIKSIIKCFSIIGLFYVGQAYAVCTRTNVTGLKINIDMGRVVVSPNAKVGDVLSSKTWAVPQTDGVYTCTEGSTIDSGINTSVLTSQSSKIHLTNVPGVGMQIVRSLNSSGTQNSYPYTYTAPRNTSVNIGAGTFKVTLYKISEDIGSGPLTAGLYSWYKAPGAALSDSALDSTISEGGTIIVTPSCSVTSGALQNVYLDSVKYSDLSAVGSTAIDTPFSIELRCSGGGELNKGYDNVELTFSGTIPTSLTNSDGVLVNDVESTGAQGVGIQVLDGDKKPLKFNSKYTVGSLTGAESGYNIITNYTARYYRYANTISTGTVESKMVFSITYD